MKKIVIVAIKIISVTVVMLGVYYLFVLRPSVASSKSILAVENTLRLQKDTLLQNKIAVMELISLNPIEHNFNNDRGEIIKQLETTIVEGRDSTNLIIELPTVNNPEFKELISSEISVKHPNYRNTMITLYANHNESLNWIKTIDEKASKLYLYRPSRELGLLDLRTQQQEIIKRSQEAQVGLRKIKQDFTEPSLAATKDIMDQMELVTTLFEQLEIDVKANSQSAEPTRTKLITEFRRLKYQMFRFQIKPLLDNRSNQMLATQSEIIAELESWIHKLNSFYSS